MKKFLYNLATDKSKGILASFLKILLWLLSCIYGLSIRLLIVFKSASARKLPVKVISVGNITVGGTGKTTVVSYIAGYLKRKGHHLAIVSRGYKRKSKMAAPYPAGFKEMGDEPYMLMQKFPGLPVIVDTNRSHAALRAHAAYGAEEVIMDDGFQQWGIKKDLEILVIDATNPFGNRHMLPRGILREPLSSLERADIFVLTKTDYHKNLEDILRCLNAYNPDALIVESVHKPIDFYELSDPAVSVAPETLRRKRVTLFSGIGDPVSFEHSIKSLGLKIGLSIYFEDHHNYTKKDLERVLKASQGENIDTIITTEKDAARISGLKLDVTGLNALVLRIGLQIKRNEDKFCDRLHKLCAI